LLSQDRRPATTGVHIQTANVREYSPRIGYYVFYVLALQLFIQLVNWNKENRKEVLEGNTAPCSIHHRYRQSVVSAGIIVFAKHFLTGTIVEWGVE
jgi:hypothetical protein